jgi:hypothetical protein
MAVREAAQAARADFLSGLVMVDSAMIALIDLRNLLSLSPAPENAQPAGTAKPPHSGTETSPPVG